MCEHEMSPEAQAEQRALDEAVDRWVKFQNSQQDEPVILTQYVLLAASTLVSDADFRDRTAYDYTYLNGTCPDHIVEGLIKVHQHRLALDRERQEPKGDL